MEQTGCSETVAYKTQMPWNHPEESIQQMIHLRRFFFNMCKPGACSVHLRNGFSFLCEELVDRIKKLKIFTEILWNKGCESYCTFYVSIL
jgi:hypothetical protein